VVRVAFVGSVIAFVLALVLSGCGSGAPAGAVASADTQSAAWLSFGADWSVAQSAPLVGGAAATLHYDFARLPRCRAREDGVAAWNVYAGMNADGGPERDVVLTRTSATELEPIDATFTVPFGGDLAIWFHNSDAAGCSDWDSDYGRNFHFAIAAPDAAVIHFRRDWTIFVDGALLPGRDVIIDYDLARAPFCRATESGNQTWDVLVDWRIGSGDVTQTSLTQVDASNQRVAAPARLHIPDGAHVLELWFENNDRTGCHQYDSAYGQNYSFHL